MTGGQALIPPTVTAGDVTAALAELGPAAADGEVSGFICGAQVGVRQGPLPKALVYRWLCPLCDPGGPLEDAVGLGQHPDGSPCPHCYGTGLTNDVGGFEGDARPAPIPPAVMKAPCVDCAFRPGSPERESGMRQGTETPFFCHHGLVRIGDGYAAPALAAGMPLGAMVCRGWYDVALGAEPPTTEFRDPGGADRREDAPQ